MMRKLVIALLIPFLSCTDTKNKSETKVETAQSAQAVKVEPKKVELSTLEKISKEEKLKLIDRVKHHFEYLTTYDGWQTEILDDVFFVDIDDDRDLDCVFTGWSGGEPVCVRIYCNKNGEYKEVFEGYQTISNLEFVGNKLSKIAIHDPGCCAAYIEFDEEYEFDISKDEVNYRLVNRTALLYPTEVPENYLAQPINFQVLNDKYFLRLTPKIDTVDQDFAEDTQPDNVIAEFKKGTRGVAYAKRSDETGRVWWFVEIDPKYKPVKSLFYDIHEKPTKLKGWMSSNYLEVIK